MDIATLSSFMAVTACKGLCDVLLRFIKVMESHRFWRSGTQWPQLLMHRTVVTSYILMVLEILFFQSCSCFLPLLLFCRGGIWPTNGREVWCARYLTHVYCFLTPNQEIQVLFTFKNYAKFKRNWAFSDGLTSFSLSNVSVYLTDD